jgi:mannose/fructose/N-acetylgalactosamine-specific phosphotransferase system component IIC
MLNANTTLPCAGMHKCVYSWSMQCPCVLAGRAVGLSAGSLVAGIMLGAALNAWLRVDIVPIGVSKLAPQLVLALPLQPIHVSFVPCETPCMI